MKTRLMPLVFQNLLRGKTTAMISILGITIALSLFLFFSALTQGVRTIVFDRIFLTDSITVVPKKVTMGVFASNDLKGPKFDPALMKELEGIEGVKSVHPRMNFVFPSGYTGSVDELVNGVMNSKWMKRKSGRISFEMISDGIGADLIISDLKNPDSFRDLGADTRCNLDEDCGVDGLCAAGRCTTKSCVPNAQKSTCSKEMYCADTIGRDGKREHRCESPIPVVVSEHLLEVYNGGIARAMNLPAISKDITDAVQPTIPIRLGTSFMSRGDPEKTLRKKIRLVGVSRRAIPVGITMPLGYVQRFNKYFKGDTAGTTFHSVVIKVKDQRHIDRIKTKIETLNLNLSDDTTNAEKAGQILRTVEMVLSLLSMLILTVVALNLAQLFFLVIRQRKRELGLLRSLGATRGDLRRLIHLEASVIGFVGSLAACVLSVLAGLALDLLLPFVPYFPYKPESLFVYEPLTFLIAIAVAQAFCLLGAYWPARKAARLSPARALTEI